MAKLLVSVSDDDYAEIKAASKRAGLTTSGYIRTVLKASDRRSKEQTELLRSIRALVPTIAEALGRTQEKEPKQIDWLIGKLLERYTKECGVKG